MVTCMPSLNGVPPQPPAGRSESTCSAPVSGSAALAKNQLHSEHVGAITWSGIALDSASQIAAVIFDEVAVVQPNVGAGQDGFSHVPSGISRSIWRYSPALGGASGLQEELQRVVDRRGGVAVGRVDRPDRDRIAPAQVDRDPVAAHHQLQSHVHRVLGEPVAVDVVAALVVAVGDPLDRGGGHPLGVVEHLAHALLDHVGAVLVGQPDHLVAPGAQGSDLRLDVALDVLRRAGAVLDDRDELVVELAGAVEHQRRQPQALAADVGVEVASDVGPVGAADRDRQQLAVVEHRHRHRHIGRVGAALVGVVEDHDVARLQLRHREPLQRCRGREVHRGDVHRAVGGLADQLPVRIEDRVGVIDHVVDDRRERGLLKHLAHALGRVLERATQDLERDRIQALAGLGR